MRPEKKYIWAAALGLLLFASCQKEVSDTTPDPPPTDTTDTVSEADRIKDSVLGYSREIYLWYQQIPTTFNPRTYADPAAIMTAIRQYSTEPGFSNPVDRWSFAMKTSEWNDLSSGIVVDFGLGVFFRAENDLRVKSVEAASPAGLAGIRRGWRIVKINGNSSINTNNIDFVVNAIFESNQTNFTFEKPDGTTADISLNAATYQENPIQLDTVYSTGNNKIGYLVFNSFLGDTTQVYNAFQTIFSDFAAQQVVDVVIDLRYNQGGYVSMQEKLANYLAPLAANNNLMMAQIFNDKYATLLNSTTNFKKLGSLNLPRLFFIVSQSTASASELLINNLKPYADVQVVGPQKTYGKPVGYFPIEVADWSIFPISFRTTNKNSEGSYFDGLALNKQVDDGLDKDWGDLQESCLASIVNYIKTGIFLGAPGPSVYRQNIEVVRSNEQLSKPYFKGMVDVRSLH